MKFQVIVDQSAQASLELIQRLQTLGETNHQGDGIYVIEADERAVLDLTDKFPQAVMKIETIASKRGRKEKLPIQRFDDFANLVASLRSKA